MERFLQSISYINPTKKGGKKMFKLKSVFAFILLGFLGLQCNVLVNAQELVKTKKDTTGVKSFVFSPLPYAYDALEPYIDKQTIEIHYSKHHKTYYENFIKAIKGSEMESMDIKELFRNISKYPMAVRNNGGGYFNHAFYWEGLIGKGKTLPEGKLLEAIKTTFGSFEDFKKQFSDAGKMRFGSGWAWLCLDDKGKLFISSTPNQDNPMMDITEKKGIPLLVMDVWEHAYYLKYQNKRADYIDAFWNIVNWEEVSKRYAKAF